MNVHTVNCVVTSSCLSCMFAQHEEKSQKVLMQICKGGQIPLDSSSDRLPVTGVNHGILSFHICKFHCCGFRYLLLNVICVHIQYYSVKICEHHKEYIILKLMGF